MALNFPGPFEVRFFYDVTPTSQALLDHVLKLSCNIDGGAPDPGTPFDDIWAVARSTNTRLLDAVVDEFVAVWRAIYGAECNMNYAELWAYEPGTFDASFISSYDISLAGTNASPGSSISAYQEIYVFRTQEGGSMRVTLQETKQSRGAPYSYSDLAQIQKNLVDLFTSTTNVWIGRDTSFPFSFTHMFPGENEALFKKRFRP